MPAALTQGFDYLNEAVWLLHNRTEILVDKAVALSENKLILGFIFKKPPFEATTRVRISFGFLFALSASDSQPFSKINNFSCEI